MTNVVSLPCDRCVHLVVCAIAPLVRDAIAPFRAPKWTSTVPDAIEIDIEVSVSCEYFLATAAASEPGPNIPETIPLAVELDNLPPEPIDAAEEMAENRRLLHAAIHSPKPATVPLTVEHLQATGHAPKPAKVLPLTGRHVAVIGAIRAAEGSQKLAALALGIHNAKVNQALADLRKSGRLPVDVEELLEPHRHPRKTKPARLDGHAAMVRATNDRDLAAARQVAAHAREREAVAAVEHDDFVATREARARERANANIAARRQA